jgi:hypothetical protein
MVSVTDPCGRILGFLDSQPLLFVQVAPQLYSRGWVDPVRDPLILKNLLAPGIEPGPLDLLPMLRNESCIRIWGGRVARRKLYWNVGTEPPHYTESYIHNPLRLLLLHRIRGYANHRLGSLTLICHSYSQTLLFNLCVAHANIFLSITFSQRAVLGGGGWRRSGKEPSLRYSWQ